MIQNNNLLVTLVKSNFSDSLSFHYTSISRVTTTWDDSYSSRKINVKNLRRKKKWKDPVKSYHSSLYFLWQIKSGYMIGPGSKKNKLADESTRCMTFTEKVDAEEVGIWWD